MKLIFTGPGKGKTSAAAGIAFRSWGHGRKVLVLLFLKDQRISGEWKAAHYLDSPRLVVKSFGRPCPYLGQTCCPGQQECIVTRSRWEIEDEEWARAGLTLAEEEIKADRWNLIVLDEILVALYFGMVSEEEIILLLDKAHEGQDVLLTGRNATSNLISLADVVTEMVERKHYYRQGIKARIGIDE